MSLIKNAIASIELGLDDFNSGDDKRLVSAVRNCYAGIMLLFKAKLLSLSPPGSNDVLLKQHVIPKKNQDGNLIFVGKGKKTVDFQQIQDRFKQLGIRTDWDRMKKINDIRNDMEHYHCGASRDAIRGMLSDTFLIVRDFMTHELEEDPMLRLSEGAWDTLLSVSEVFEKEKEESIAKLEGIDWESEALGGAVLEIACNACGSQLLAPSKIGHYSEIDLVCRSCGEKEDSESFIPRAISDYFASENHLSVRDGGEEVTIMCPFCFTESYVMDEHRCAHCGESATHCCQRCGTNIPTSEISDGSLCGWCEHMSSKDD